MKQIPRGFAAEDDYIELRAHTCFSFSDGAVSPEALAKRARQLGFTHLGITDTADLGVGRRFAGTTQSTTVLFGVSYATPLRFW